MHCPYVHDLHYLATTRKLKYSICLKQIHSKIQNVLKISINAKKTKRG